MPAKIYKAFTMIELLIVIAVLGILAVAVLSAINPIEQINRSRDTGSRSDAEQLISASDRFYANNGYYPWQVGATSTAQPDWIDVNMLWFDDAAPPVEVLNKLSQSGTEELKSSFIDRITNAAYNTLKVYNAGTAGGSTYVCFNPKSASFRNEATLRCGGTLPTDFPTTDACGSGSPAVYWSCLP